MIATFSYMTKLKKQTLLPTTLCLSQMHATLKPKLNLAMPMAVGFFALFWEDLGHGL
jgi:hypothetical protein